ncbi:MAG: tetratricopeptide repeat protein [Desulfobacterales bacterium]|nr:tetratricopeptide repeat protein [Desulfobacterales bacterium]
MPPITPAAPPKPTENDWLAKGKAHFAKRNFQDALSAFSKAIEINANFAAAYFDRGVVFTKLGANRRAVDDLKAAARLNHKKARDFLTSKKIPW